MRSINVVLDLYSAAICLILFSYLFFRRGRRDRMRSFFLLLCASNLGMALGDLPNWLWEGLEQSWYPAALWSGTLVYWICSSLLLLWFTAYLIEFLAPKVRVSRRFWYGALVLCALHIGGILLSVWNGMFFTITPDNIYQRGDLFFLSQLLPFSIYALDICIFIIYRKNLQPQDFRILSSYMLLPITAEAVQMFFYGVALVNTGVSLGLLIIFVNIQSEQELRIERQEKELEEARIDIMLSQIQPHFLYNALTAIRCLCDRDPRQAKDAIQNFALFLRGNMDSLKSKKPIPFDQELAHVEHYLALEQQRFQDRLHVVYEIGARDFSIPPLTLQPIVENAVRHGILRRENGGTVTIHTEEMDLAYVVRVTDDGVGFQPKQSSPGSRSHIGIENVRGRLAALCGGTLDLKSGMGMGTTITITIPKEEAHDELL